MILNIVLTKIPIEHHVAGYQYCGSGTDLEEIL